MQKQSSVFIILTIIILYGAFLRLYDLGKHDFISDELDHVYVAKSLINQDGALLPSGKPYQRALLYSYLVELSFKIFGESEYAARLPSALFSIFMIPLIYLFSRYFLHDNVIGLCAAALLALDPWSIMMARFSRMYTMLAFAYLVLLILFYKGVDAIGAGPEDQDGKSRVIRDRLGWTCLILCAILFLVTYKIHDLILCFLLVVTFYLVYIVIDAARLKNQTERSFMSGGQLRVVLGVFICVLIVSLLFRDRIMGFLQMARNISSAPPWWNIAGPLYYLERLKKYYIWHPWSLAMIALIWMVVSGKRKMLFLSFSFIVPLVALSIVPMKSFRFVYYISPVFVVLMSYALINLVRWLVVFGKEHKNRQGMTGMAMLAIIVSLLWFGKGTIINWRNAHEIPLLGINLGLIEWPSFYGKDMEEVSAFLKKNVNDDDLIASDYCYELMYYYGKIDYHIPERGETSEGFSLYFLDGGRARYYYTGSKVLMNRSDLEDVTKGGRRLWIIADCGLLNNNMYEDAQFGEYLDKSFNLKYETSSGQFRVYESQKRAE